MITRSDILDALTKCVGYDPIHSPKQSLIIEDAWYEHFERYPTLQRQDLLSAVADYYSVPQRPWPQPADISNVARAKRRDQADRAPLELDKVPVSDERRQEHLARIQEVIGGQAKKWDAQEVPERAVPVQHRHSDYERRKDESEEAYRARILTALDGVEQS
jgi:hypothetical protein